MPESTMPNVSESSTYDVFLSHGSPDKPWVRTLHARLTAAGVVAYLDEIAIEAGDDFVCNLSNGIGQASTFVIVVSRDTISRPWVEKEWTSFMATHGPRHRIIPVCLDDVPLPPFLRSFQAIKALDRNVDVVAARIVRAVGKRDTSRSPASYSGRSLIFTVASLDGGAELAITATDGTQRRITPPWRQGNAFGVALMDFERLTRETALDDAARGRLVTAAQTVGASLFAVLCSDAVLQDSFAQAMAPGTRAVVTVQSDDDVLLSLPWELLFHESRFLVRDGVLDVVRSTLAQVQFETQLTPPTEPFSVVTHIAAPEGSALNYEAESFRLTRALTDHCPHTATELGTLQDLVNTVSQQHPRGIHFSGHGAPGALIFEDEDGFESRIDIERVATELRREADGSLPPFFYLASCYGNTPAKPSDGQSGSSSSAARLHRHGVTEVVGYYGPIADELSTRAEEALYAAIAAGLPTRQAVAKARAALQRAFDGDETQSPSPRRGLTATLHDATFAWAQLVFYRRGPEYPLGTPASPEKLRQREAALKRTYRNIEDRAFLETGFIGRRLELHLFRRRLKRGDPIFVLQGLGGLGKTTLAGQFLPLLADDEHVVTIWCRRTEGERDQAEALVSQLLSYARARFGAGFEPIVSHVDRAAGEHASKRFVAFLQVIAAQQPANPLVVYLDNLESLLHGPAEVSTAPDVEAFAEWRTEELRLLWRGLTGLAGAFGQLYVVASCRYRNEDLMPAILPVSSLADADLFRLMAWFPALRRLSTAARGRLAGRLSGHPRAVEFLDPLMAASIRSWEDTHGEWAAPAVLDAKALQREWEQIVAPALPDVQERIWSDLLLATIWDRVLDEPTRRMLFRMTLLRRPWDGGLIPHLGDPEEDTESCRHAASVLANASLLGQIALTVRSLDGQMRRPFFTVHAATVVFVRSRFGSADDVRVASHRRIGAYLETLGKTSSDLAVRIEAGHHLFEAEEYDRAAMVLGPVSESLGQWGRIRESLQLLLPFLAEPVQQRMTQKWLGPTLGMVGIAYYNLGDTRRAIDLFQQTLTIVRDLGDRRRECATLGNIGSAYAALGETHRAIDHHQHALALAREIGNRRGEGEILGNLGNAYQVLSDTRRAIEHHEQALAIARDLGNCHGEVAILNSLGHAYQVIGETRRAIDYLEQAVSLSRETNDRRGESTALGSLGAAYRGSRDIRRAIEHHEQALAISRETGDRRAQGQHLGNVGVAYAALGETHRAIEYFSQLFAIARETADRRAEGMALSNLGAACIALNEIGRAIDFYQKSLSIGEETSDPELVRVSMNGLMRCAAAT